MRIAAAAAAATESEGEAAKAGEPEAEADEEKADSMEVKTQFSAPSTKTKHRQILQNHRTQQSAHLSRQGDEEASRSCSNCGRSGNFHSPHDTADAEVSDDVARRTTASTYSER